MPSYRSHSPVGWTGTTDGIEAESADQLEAAASDRAAEVRGRDEELVRAVLDEMSPADHEVLRLSFGQELDVAEIAVSLGVSVRRARAQLEAATSRFEARSIAVALTRPARIGCPVLAELVSAGSAADAGLPERHCKLVAEHSVSCPACRKVVAEWNVGSALFDILAELILAQPTRVAPSEPDEKRPGRFWERSPVLVVASTAAVLVIGVGAAGVIKLTGHQSPNAAAPAASPPQSSQSPRPAPSPSTLPSPAGSPSASPGVVVPPPVVRQSTKSTSPTPKPSPSDSSSPSPSPTTPSSSSS
ncbi:MAG: sigma factor-like helix-turn-helix DNA-binding protein [Streptosporangiaceae bacterium]